MRFSTLCTIRPAIAIFIVIALLVTPLASAPSAAEASAYDEVLNIVSLGDSYTAGIGAFGIHENPPGCQKGQTSQARTLQQDLQSKGWQVELNEVASCLGYVTEDIEEFINDESGQGLPIVRQADVVFLGIGGNDVGFVPKMLCVAGLKALEQILALYNHDPAATHGCVNNGDNWVLGASPATTQTRIEDLIREIASKTSPGITIFVKNYPNVFGSSAHNDWNHIKPQCIALATTFTPSVQSNVRALTAQLNDAIANAVNNTDGHNGVNVELLDINFLYEGRGICGSGDAWINGPDTILGVFDNFDNALNAVHPTQAGIAAESQWYEAMLGQHYNKADFDGHTYVAIPWGQYIGDIIKYDDGDQKSWFVTATGLRHIYDGGDFLCFQAQGATVHTLSRSFIDSLPQGSDIRCTPDPVQPSGPNVYGDLPLACGTHVPYASTYDTYLHFYHGHALDFPVPQGTLVVAPASGQVTVRNDPDGYGNYIDLTDANGVVHRMAHMLSDGLVANGSHVQKSQAIGKVGSTGASTGPHLHYERRSGGSQIEIHMAGDPLQWGPRFSSGGDRHTTHKLISGNCDPAGVNSFSEPQHMRFGSLSQSGCLWVKEDSLNGSWTNVACNVADFELENNRVFILNNQGTLFGKVGSLNSSWTQMATGVVGFDAEGTRVGIVYPGGNAYAKEGPLNATWRHLDDNAREIQLEDHRIAIVRKNNHLLVKEPYISSHFTNINTATRSFVMDGDRIMVNTIWDTIMAKDGAINAAWVTFGPTGETEEMVLAGDRIGILFDTGKLVAKDGSLYAPWVTLASAGAVAFDMTDARTMQAMDWGMIRAKEPALDAQWINLMQSGVLDVEAEGDYIGFVSAAGNVFAKSGALNTQWFKMTTNGAKIQIEEY